MPRNMKHVYYNYPHNYPHNYNHLNQNGDRFFGGAFLAPFLLGGIAGAAVARPPYYGPPPMYPVPINAPMPMPMPPQQYYTSTNYYY